jgi:hypothetical protein
MLISEKMYSETGINYAWLLYIQERVSEINFRAEINQSPEFDRGN